MTVRSSASKSHRRAQRGAAITESLLIVSFAAVSLAAIPAIADYGTKRLQTVSAAKLVSWQRNVWLPEPTAIDAAEATLGATGAISKADAEVTRDLRRHIFRDRTQAGTATHAPELAEFGAVEPPIDPRTVSVAATTTAEPMPWTLNAAHLIAGLGRVPQTELISQPLTKSLGQFNFITSGYLRNEVAVTQADPRFSLVPNVSMKEHVTMLTEAWNAGGTNREETKVQGLVPAKVFDIIYWQQFRSPFTQVANTVKQIYPKFDTENLQFGLTPGDAGEKVPLDRFERVRGEGPFVPGRQADHFRYYRAFPPTPVVSTLP